MMFNDRMTLCKDGAYRWTYDMKAHHNYDPFRYMMKVVVAVSVPVALIMLVMIWPMDPKWAVLSALMFLALMVLLPAGLWLLMLPNPSFRLSETEIEAWPKGKGANIFALTSVRRVMLCPDRDLIKLRVPLGGVRVYVPQEDFELLSDFLTEHLMGRAEFIRD